MEYLLSLIMLVMAVASFAVAGLFIYAHSYMLLGVAMVLVGMLLSVAAGLVLGGVNK